MNVKAGLALSLSGMKSAPLILIVSLILPQGFVQAQVANGIHDVAVGTGAKEVVAAGVNQAAASIYDKICHSPHGALACVYAAMSAAQVIELLLEKKGSDGTAGAT